MKLHGIVKGKMIELATDPELLEGQRVVVELEIPPAEFSSDALYGRDLENRIATDPALEDIRQARAIRERIAARLGGSRLNSVELIREDRRR